LQNNTTYLHGYALYNNGYQQVHDNISIQANNKINPHMIINDKNIVSNGRIYSNTIPSNYPSHIPTRTNDNTNKNNNTNMKVRFNN
jgi:hypothetical protein